MEEWIEVWGTIVGKAKRMDDFPMWLQYYPKVLFDIINRSGVCSFSCFLRVSSSWMKWPIFCCSLPGTGVITKSELKFFYTAFMDVGKLGEAKLDEITNNAYEALTSVNYSSVTFFLHCAHFFTRQPKVLYCELHCSSNLIRYNSVLRRAVLLKTKRVVQLKHRKIMEVKNCTYVGPKVVFLQISLTQ